MESHLRTSAFVAITLSTVAVASCLMMIPLMFHYVQLAESNAQMEIEWRVLPAPSAPRRA